MQAEQLSSELTTLMADLRQLERQNQLLTGELETLRGQDRAKDQALEEALQVTKVINLKIRIFRVVKCQDICHGLKSYNFLILIHYYNFDYDKAKKR